MSQLTQIFDNLFATEVLSKDYMQKSFYSKFEKLAESGELESVRPQVYKLRSLFGKEGEMFSTHIGTHPDFLDMEKLPSHQYICSVFLDISGSTKLGLKFPLEKVRLYKNAILTTASEIFQAFDGHIHRLQGDAVFAFFGHQQMQKSDAIINALNASAVMQAYNKNSLSGFFEENDLPPLKIRIGIDIGDDNQVLWSTYGLDGAGEVTTTSLHTDLAAKLQNKAPKNQILLGENIFKYLDLPDEFLKDKVIQQDGQDVTKRYILEDSRLNTYYKMKIFKWETYLKTFNSYYNDSKLSFSAPDDFEIICKYGEENGPVNDYKQNSYAIKKELYAGFQLVLKGNLKFIKPSKIKWKVINRGYEATKANVLEYYVDEYEDQYTCYRPIGFNVHHLMECRLYNSHGSLIGRSQFGIYVNDDKNSMKIIGVKEKA
ncbi:guanylate cyclase [Pontibacillus chungwhensis BH030062]|uniref:Guanylate cyclase n=1 Tax=Pontibacillus chungwhensis BH030062 TaxID=1385513 RepID=A0A0A2UPU0_9BACI|nr:adenylate/guanylate cyclase domain-containing protein [Pontibacillus chungwhensis]KGP89949.1 guanylate cyclase [Pontibacillus chungwhensis BH030062]